ncbi:microfibril-associated glycoprotein 4-like [Drosophila willistoni]|uniref:microfibril-associated glycoprotein 4-like n=1 Tax=Drosophila willistoni TaxID=7260 RepID=UPI001F0790D9|nr:microfibril-associated glycoprotein 4-like [Drosophila willistoni]
MKVVLILLAVICLGKIKCSEEKIPQSFNFSDSEIQYSDSNFTSLNDNILAVIENDSLNLGNITGPLTSCPRAFGVEGIFEITVPGLDPFPVLCNAQIAGAGYIVIASRSNAELNFFRDWATYKEGFGDLLGDFFIGLDKLHAITKSQSYELYVHLEDFEGNTRFARYDEFYIENEHESYKMSKLGTYTGNAGDSLDYHRGQKFSTYDGENNCAIGKSGAWWYKNCQNSNLFGQYYGGEFDSKLGYSGMNWDHWRGGYYSYKSIKMMVRPRCTCS